MRLLLLKIAPTSAYIGAGDYMKKNNKCFSAKLNIKIYKMNTSSVKHTSTVRKKIFLKKGGDVDLFLGPKLDLLNCLKLL